jgi:hypothetical protein
MASGRGGFWWKCGGSFWSAGSFTTLPCELGARNLLYRGRADFRGAGAGRRDGGGVRAQKVAREALAALLTFEAAAAREMATVSLAREISSRLERARRGSAELGAWE